MFVNYYILNTLKLDFWQLPAMSYQQLPATQRLKWCIFLFCKYFFVSIKFISISAARSRFNDQDVLSFHGDVLSFNPSKPTMATEPERPATRNQ